MKCSECDTWLNQDEGTWADDGKKRVILCVDCLVEFNEWAGERRLDSRLRGNDA